MGSFCTFASTLTRTEFSEVDKIDYNALNQNLKQLRYHIPPINDTHGP